MVKYERGQYRKKENRLVFVSVSTWSQYSKETFSPDAAHISDLHLNILMCVQEFSELRFFAFISLCAD